MQTQEREPKRAAIYVPAPLHKEFTEFCRERNLIIGGVTADAIKQIMEKIRQAERRLAA